MGTSSKIGGTEKLEDFFKYFEFKKDEIWLKNPKFEKPKKSSPGNGPKKTHIKFQNDRSMGTLSNIGGTERLEERRIIP